MMLYPTTLIVFYCGVGLLSSFDISMMCNNKWRLPGLFEAFPELKLPWPRWFKDNKGRRKPCKTHSDCPFPTTCCPPILIGERSHCCTGWGPPILVPAYAYNFIQPEA